ncbi:MAG TPA: hypothetical protein VF606_01745, partial [Geminicoccaceae bacterium]
MDGWSGMAATAAVPASRRLVLGLLLGAAAPPAAFVAGRDDLIGEASRLVTDGELTLLDIA